MYNIGVSGSTNLLLTNLNSDILESNSNGLSLDKAIVCLLPTYLSIFSLDWWIEVTEFLRINW